MIGTTIPPSLPPIWRKMAPHIRSELALLSRALRAWLGDCAAQSGYGEPLVAWRGHSLKVRKT